jgi:hypothetical protein
MANIAAYVLAPALPLFAVMRFGPMDNNNASGFEPRLPEWLSYFQTPDNSLWGDATFQRLNGPRYWSMVKWLWRNPAYGFERAVLGAKIRPADVPVVKGDPDVQDGPAGKEGFCFIRISSYWNLVWVKRSGNTRCWYFNLGWKLKTYAENPARVLTEPVAQFVVSPRRPLFRT